MSIGGGKSKTTQQQSSSSFLDPTIVGAQLGNIANAKAAVGSIQPFTGQRVAGFNANQTAAQGGLLAAAGEHLGSGLLGRAAQAATAASTYQPTQITAPTAQGGPAVTASTATARPDVTTGAITADQIANYQNPFENDVVQTSLADLERQRQIEQTYNAAQATKAHAFGGTGAAVLSGLTNDNYGRAAASTAANLRSQGFGAALAAAQQDEARRLQAEQGNQAAGNQAAEFNASQTQGADIFNSGQTQARGLLDAQQQLEAEKANQSADLSGAGLNLQSGGLLANLANQQRDFALGDIGLTASVGDAQQAQQQKEMDAALAAWKEGADLTLQQQQLVNQAFAILGNPTLMKSQGTSNTRQSNFNFGLPAPPPA